MYSVRKIISVILALAMVFAMSASVFAASFPDLEGHWSKTFMDDMSKRGLLSGYPDGTMGPDRPITGAEALTFLAKLYKTNETEDAAIHEDYGKTVDAVTTTAWVKPFVEKALAAGIISEAELKALPLFEAIPKQSFSLLLVRAIKMTKDAARLEDMELTFGDVADISEACYGSVALLTKLSITVGDNNNNFGPKGNVTRAIAATMVSKILTFLEASDTVLTIDAYSGMDNASGILFGVDGKTITVRDDVGLIHVYKKAPEFAATINGSSKTTSVTESFTGSPVKLRVIDGKAVLLEITTEKGVQWVQTKLVQAVSRGTSLKTYDYYTDSTVTYDAMKATFTIGDDPLLFVALKPDDFLTMKVADKIVTEVQVVRGEFDVKGKISEIKYNGTEINITVKTEEGDILLPLDISDLPEITRAGHPSRIDKLVEGDGVVVTVLGGEIAEIAIDGTNVTTEGYIVEISQTVEGTYWTIETDNGAEKTLPLAKNVVAYSGQSTIASSAFSVGDEVSIVEFDKEITEVTLIKAHSAASSASDKLTVTVQYVDVKGKQLLVEGKDGAYFYISCPASVSILVTATGKNIRLSEITEKDEIIVYGSYDENGDFVATSIVIEDKQ